MLNSVSVRLAVGFTQIHTPNLKMFSSQAVVRLVLHDCGRAQLQVSSSNNDCMYTFFKYVRQQQLKRWLLHFHFSCQWLDTLSCVHRSCRDGHGKRYRSTYICTYICNSKFRGWCSHQAHLLLAHIKTLTLLVETIFPLSLLTIRPFVLRY